MDWHLILEIIGYMGSAMVVVSMLMTKMTYLRMFNLIGSVLTIFYTSLTGSYPVLALNIVLLLINSYYLFKFYTTKKSYDAVDCDIDGFTFKHFLNKHRNEIRQVNPQFFGRYHDSNYAKVIFCDNIVVGMLLGRKEDDRLDIYLNYIDPNFIKKDLLSYLHNKLHNDGINMEVYKDIPEKYSKQYLKNGAKKKGNDFIYIF